MTEPASYVYKHLSKDDQHALEALVESTNLLDNTCIGVLPLTLNEYLLIIPFLNPLVIFRNARHYQQLKKFGHISARSKRKMFRNVLTAAMVGFIPVFNVLWSRKFKCNRRNMRLVERTLHREEFMFLFGTTNTPDDVPLPKNVEKLFGNCPKYRRPLRYERDTTMESKDADWWIRSLDNDEAKSSTDQTLAEMENEIESANVHIKVPASVHINTLSAGISAAGRRGDSVYEDTASGTHQPLKSGEFARAAHIVRITTVASECTAPSPIPESISVSLSESTPGSTPESDTSSHELGQWREHSAESLGGKEVCISEKQEKEGESGTPAPAGWTDAPFAVARYLHSYLWPPPAP